VFLIFLAGCTTNFYFPGNQKGVTDNYQNDLNAGSDQIIETIPISGIGDYVEVSSQNTVILVVSGIENNVKVVKGTNIQKIVLFGINNNIALPSGATPEIQKSGVDNVILYYE